MREFVADNRPQGNAYCQLCTHPIFVNERIVVLLKPLSGEYAHHDCATRNGWTEWKP